MTRAVRGAFSLLLPSLLWACTTTERSAQPVSHEYGGTALAIQFDKTVHFTAPDGAPVLAGPDAYLVEQTMDAQLRLAPEKGGSPLIVAADKGTHDLEVSAPFPLVLALNDDAGDVVLLMRDGTALDASGSLSGVQARDIVRQRRHYQLAYQLNPATGQVQFGDDAIGQRPPAGQPSVSSNYRIGAGAAGNPSASSTSDSGVSMIPLLSVVSDRQVTQALAAAVTAAQHERFRLE